MLVRNKSKPFLILYFFVFSCKPYIKLLPSHNDYKLFAQRRISNGHEVFHFRRPPIPNQIGSTLGVNNRDFNAVSIKLDSFISLHKTNSFLIIRNDTILYEKYKNNHYDTSLVSSFSMAKPFISTLIGIAIDEGKINSVDDRIIDYLNEFQHKNGWEKIKIKHLLKHTSGINFSDRILKLNSDNLKFYWGKDIRKEISKAKLETDPGAKFKYSSINTQLLGLILERVTKQSISQNLEQKIWKPLQMESPAYWSLDNQGELGMEKAFCCLQARAIDFAKLGKLYCNGGIYNGKQILSKEWIKYSIQPDFSENNKYFYNNNWGIGPLKYGSFYAVGLYGQYLYIYPEKNIIIVRFGDKNLRYKPSYWNTIFLQLIDQL
jgi:CubicO group peptidase (beta-lactamase class C family)